MTDSETRERIETIADDVSNPNHEAFNAVCAAADDNEQCEARANGLDWTTRNDAFWLVSAASCMDNYSEATVAAFVAAGLDY